MKFWTNLLGYQLVWFCAVIGAGRGLQWPGVAAMLVFAACELCFSRHRKADLSLMAAASVIGFVLDGGMIREGLVSYGAAWATAAIAPAWILALWAAFALTFTHSLAYLQTRLWLAVLLGAAGGPLAYLSAARGWHAVSFAHPEWHALLWLGIGWGIAAPALAWLARYWSSSAIPASIVSHGLAP